MTSDRQSSKDPGQHPDALVLPGPDGTNPLGFLAALGLLAIVNDSNSAVRPRMGWTTAGGTWVPFLLWPSGSKLGEGELLSTLTDRLATTISDHPCSVLRQLRAMAGDAQQRRQLFERIANSGDLAAMEWLAALASDMAAPDSINQLQTPRRDYFYRNLESVIGRTKVEHLRRALFRPWDYADALDNQSLRLDPSEDRRHAYQWNQPAGDPNRALRGGMLGANRLALEAISLFPSFPEGNSLRTVGFTGTRSTNTRWTWPIWDPGLSLPVVRSLIAAEVLQKESFDSSDIAALRSQGVVAVYRTNRILVEKSPNFTPARRMA
jgi:CRISPR-associated endonuclease/helicase Cas3